MHQAKTSLAVAALLAGGLLLGACGGDKANTDTTTVTPTATLGTDSAAGRVGGMPDTSRMASPGGVMKSDSTRM